MLLHDPGTVSAMIRYGIIRRIIPPKSSSLIYTFILMCHKTTMNYSRSCHFVVSLVYHYSAESYFPVLGV